ncbi:MAG: GAP family protein, partial [Propionibacteriales bacterium]|nr:GAP family protein [Propionibacteriales bacterium]
MELSQLLVLAGLALLDSTRIGTLVLPVFLMLLPGVKSGRVLLHLATISVFYFAIGVLMLFGARGLVSSLGSALESPVAYWVQLVIGVAMFIASWFVDPGKKRAQRAKQGLPPEPSRWEQRLAGNTGTVAVITVALLAGIAELAMMLPYLG